MTMHVAHIRVGVAQFDDGWNVIVERDGDTDVYEPTFESRADAEAKAREVSAAIRKRIADAGMGIIDASGSTNP